MEKFCGKFDRGVRAESRLILFHVHRRNALNTTSHKPKFMRIYTALDETLMNHDRKKAATTKNDLRADLPRVECIVHDRTVYVWSSSARLHNRYDRDLSLRYYVKL